MKVLSEICSYNLDFYHNLLPGYDFVYRTPVKSKVGGVGMYIRSNLQYNERIDLQVGNEHVTVENTEDIWIDINKNNNCYTIGEEASQYQYLTVF